LKKARVNDPGLCCCPDQLKNLHHFRTTSGGQSRPLPRPRKVVAAAKGDTVTSAGSPSP
jgi:hypothetical protein